MKRTVRFNRFVLAFLAVGVTATSASADWHTFWHNMNVGYHRNNAWPEPFNEADAMQVAAPFEVMKRNGWRLNNTIGHELFRESDGALLASGNRRIHWIATQSPANHREVYVLRGMTPQETQARVASVHQTLAGLNLQGPAPAVMVTDVEPGTSSGEWATQVSRQWLKNMPSPQLPQTSASGAQSVATPGGP